MNIKIYAGIIDLWCALDHASISSRGLLSALVRSPPHLQVKHLTYRSSILSLELGRMKTGYLHSMDPFAQLIRFMNIRIWKLIMQPEVRLWQSIIFWCYNKHQDVRRPQRFEIFARAHMCVRAHFKARNICAPGRTSKQILHISRFRRQVCWALAIFPSSAGDGRRCETIVYKSKQLRCYKLFDSLS